MENEKLTYINSRGERLELGVDSVYHCNISKDVEGISGVTSVIYSTNSMGQHGDTYVGQRIEARDIDVVGHINTRDKAQALELRRRMLKIFNPELSATLVYEYGGFKRVIDCRAYGEPKILKKEVLYEFDLQIECLNPFWREEEETKEDIASWVAAWHFPCVIEKDSTKSMIYGYRAESVIVDCYNEGDVSTGMRIRFTALGTVSNPILLNVDTEEFIQINATMKTGDVIEINERTALRRELPQAERNRRYAGRTDRRGKDQKIAGYGAAAYLQPLAALIAGGNWNNGANCGARAVNCNNYPWNVNTNIGARGACDLVRTLQAQSSTEYWQGLRKG